MVTIVRRCSSFGEHQVQVALPSGDQLVVPEWMLDEERCQGMQIVTQPVLAFSALQALRILLDAQVHSSEQCGSVVSEASPGGACCVPTTPGSSSLGDPKNSRAASSSADALPRAAQSHAARSREQNNRRTER